MLLEVAVSLNDVHLELEDDDHDVHVVILNDVHLELEDDDHGVHVVMPPSQLQGRDEEAEDDQVEGPELEEEDGLKDEFDESDVAEVAAEVENVMDSVVKMIL